MGRSKKNVTGLMLVSLSVLICLMFSACISKSKVTITDIADWEHPVKAVLEQNGIKIHRIELTKDKKYPTFYVDFPEIMSDPLSLDYSLNVIKSTAEANGFWDFTFFDENRNIKIDVYCDRENKTVYKYIINGIRTIIVNTDEAQPEYQKYTSFLHTDKKVEQLIEEDMDLDGNKEIIIIGQFDDSGITQYCVLREAGNKLQYLGNLGNTAYEITGVELVRLEGSDQKYINAICSGWNLSGFYLYQVVKDEVKDIESSASASSSGLDQLTSSSNNGIYDGYSQDREGYNVMNFSVSRNYKWNGNSFGLSSITVDVGEYPETPVDVINQFLRLNYLTEDDKKCPDVSNRINLINISNKNLKMDELPDDWRDALCDDLMNNIQYDTKETESRGTITASLMDKKITFSLEKNNNKWQIINMSGDAVF
jgi:hypothetical protein